MRTEQVCVSPHRELRFGRRLPHLQEQERDDQRTERRQHVRQGVVDIIRGNELAEREGAARDQKNRPQRLERTHSAIERHHVERQQKRDERQLAADHGAERPRRQACDRAKRRHRNAERAESDRRGVEDQRKHQRFERREADQNEKRRGDRDRRSKAGDAFQKRAEAEADHHQHDAAIVGKMVENPRPKGVEPVRTRLRYCRGAAR